VTVRNEHRSTCHGNFSISWQGQDGLTCSASARGANVSDSGVGVSCADEFSVGLAVYIQAQDNGLAGYGVVRHCTPQAQGFVVGIEMNEKAAKPTTARREDSIADYYEFLQISSKAESATIQRVHRFLAARYHPDNPETGDPERFLLLNQAYAVLSDPEKRAEYDLRCGSRSEAGSTFESVDFMDGVDGEVNRRLAVLSLLYRRCRASVENPRVTLAEMETLMGFPREYLDFTTWYLRSKKFITREDNSDFALTVLGVDYVEANYSKLPVLRKMLNAASTERHGYERRGRNEHQEKRGEGIEIGTAGGAGDPVHSE